MGPSSFGHIYRESVPLTRSAGQLRRQANELQVATFLGAFPKNTSFGPKPEFHNLALAYLYTNRDGTRECHTLGKNARMETASWPAARLQPRRPRFSEKRVDPVIRRPCSSYSRRSWTTFTGRVETKRRRVSGSIKERQTPTFRLDTSHSLRKRPRQKQRSLRQQTLAKSTLLRDLKLWPQVPTKAVSSEQQHTDLPSDWESSEGLIK